MLLTGLLTASGLTCWFAAHVLLPDPETNPVFSVTFGLYTYL